MNAAQAKKISLYDLLSSLGHNPVETRKLGTEVWYRSPFRNEKESSFKIKIDQNIWYDFGEGEGGNIIDFVMKFKTCGFNDALSFLGKKTIKPSLVSSLSKENDKQQNLEFIEIESPSILSVKPIFHFALKNYLRDRCISPEIGFKYLKEITYKVEEKNYFALGFENISGGWEVRNHLFKGCIGKKDISLIETGSDRVSVFEGFFDFLSSITLSDNEDLATDVVVLNSTSMRKKGIQVIKNKGYKKIDAYFDNDAGGKCTLELFQNELPDIELSSKNHLYKPFKDFNEYLIKTLQTSNLN